MAKDNVIDLKKPESFVDDPITDILRQGARRLLAAALAAETESFLANTRTCTTISAVKGLYESDYLPEREIQTGIGQIPVKAPRFRDRRPAMSQCPEKMDQIAPS